jgi:hypothetical protein
LKTKTFFWKKYNELFFAGFTIPNRWWCHFSRSYTGCGLFISSQEKPAFQWGLYMQVIALGHSARCC